MNPALPKELALVVVFIIANCLIAAPLVRFFAKTLTFKQSLNLSVRSFVPASLAIIGYLFARMILDFTAKFDGLATLAAICLAGVIITSRAERDYGVVKDGILGIGGKTALTLIALSWLLFAINLATHIFI